MNEHPDFDSSYRIELVRKAIHLCSLSIPIVYYFISRQVALWIIIPLTIAFVAVDIARYYYPPVQQWFYRWFGSLLRPRESNAAHKRLNGATYVLISATICIFLFPKPIAITSFSILIISDLMAALIGKRFGRHRFFGKTIEGSLAFFLSAVVVVLLAPKVHNQAGEYLIGTVAAAAGTIVEALPIEIDDNLSIPLVIGAIMWVLTACIYNI